MTTSRTKRSKPSAAMAALIEGRKAPSDLLADIKQHAVKQALADRSRRQDIIHPSEMAKVDWCPRATAFRIRGVEPTNPVKAHGHRMLTIFQEGHDVHSKWQTWLGEMGRLWGKWKCPVCEHVEWGVGALGCQRDHAPVRMDYKEVPLDAEDEWLICGHADGAVPDIKSFIEIKTIGLGTLRMEEPALVREYTLKTTEGKSVTDFDGLWKALKRPLKSHRRQALVYLAIARLRGWDYEQMVFIYENKANQDTKEFVLRFTDDAVAELIEQAKDIKWAVEQQRDLPRPTTFAPDSAPCKECVFRDHCYADKEPTSNAERDQEQDVADGGSQPGSEAEVGSATDLHAEQALARVPRTARRSDGTRRQRTDAPLRPADEVGRVPEHATGGSGGRRTVRRRVPRTSEGD